MAGEGEEPSAGRCLDTGRSQGVAEAQILANQLDLGFNYGAQSQGETEEWILMEDWSAWAIFVTGGVLGGLIGGVVGALAESWSTYLPENLRESRWNCTTQS